MKGFALGAALAAAALAGYYTVEAAKTWVRANHRRREEWARFNAQPYLRLVS